VRTPPTEYTQNDREQADDEIDAGSELQWETQKLDEHGDSKLAATDPDETRGGAGDETGNYGERARPGGRRLNRVVVG
jgi:hypothetical protein